MRKTTVYLDDDEIAALRRLASATGLSQAQLIRSAIRHAVESLPPRRFRSLGRGEGTGERNPRWDVDDVYEKAFGER